LTTHTFDTYQFDLPDGWTIIGRFPVLNAYKPDGVGKLTFVSFEPDRPSTLDHWSNFDGQIAGKVSTTKNEKAFSKTWFFIQPNGTALQVNYRCRPSQADIELAEVDQILSTLREI
jgi:hypothetical protein